MTGLGDLLDVGIVPVLVEAFERRQQRRLREAEEEAGKEQSRDDRARYGREIHARRLRQDGAKSTGFSVAFRMF